MFGLAARHEHMGEPPSSPIPAPAKPLKATASAPAKAVKRRKRSILRPEGSGSSRRSQLWAELKRLAAGRAAKLSNTQVSTEQFEPRVEEAEKAR